MFYHVRIDYYDSRLKGNQTKYGFDYMSEEEIFSDVLHPYVNKRNFIFQGCAIMADEIRQVRIYQTNESIGYVVEYANTIDHNALLPYDEESILDNSQYVIEITRQFYKKFEKMAIMPNENRETKPKKIFISHSSGDGEFAKALVNLLVLMGFDAKKEIFCSSVPDCWVEDGEDFISVIKKHFDENELYVIYIHSPRFYERHITLNEMGAAWALQSAYSSFLTKDMSFGEMDAVVPNTKVAIKVDIPEAEARMNSWRKRILAWFGKDEKNDSLWEMHRNSFLKYVRDLSYPKKEEATKAPVILQREEVRLSTKEEDILKQWVNSNSNEMYKAEYIGGGCIMLGDTDYQYETAREEADWNDFFRRLLKMGFIESTGRGGDSARYILTAKAYKYFD